MPRGWVVDVMRGWAAILVLLSHSDTYRLIPIPWAEPLKILAGETGVDLFFILSGYLIWTSASRTLDKPGGLGVYVIHRVTRIAPLYYVALAVAIFAAPFFIGSWKPEPTENGVLRHLMFAQSLTPAVSREINPVLWTLTHEAIYYAIVPLLWLVRSALWAFLPLSVVLAIAAYDTGFGAFAPFVQVAFLFSIGFSIAHYKLASDWRAALIGFVVVALLWGREWRLLAPTCALALFVFFSALPDHRAVRLALRPVALVGTISYSVYIWHYLAVEFFGPQIIHNHTWLFHTSWLYSLSFIACVLGLSTITYVLIEKPFMTVVRDALLRLAPSGKPAIRFAE